MSSKVAKKCGFFRHHLWFQIARTVMSRCVVSDGLEHLRSLCDVITRPRVQVMPRAPHAVERMYGVCSDVGSTRGASTFRRIGKSCDRRCRG